MYLNNLKKLRENQEYTQNEVASMIKVNRSTYNSWERGEVMIPIEKADELSLVYKVKLSYVLGIEKKYIVYPDIKEMNYDSFLEKLNALKKQNKNTYEEIGTFLNCASSTCQRYFKNEFKIPIDRLILICEFYKVNLDIMLNKCK